MRDPASQWSWCPVLPPPDGAVLGPAPGAGQGPGGRGKLVNGVRTTEDNSSRPGVNLSGMTLDQSGQNRLAKAGFGAGNTGAMLRASHASPPQCARLPAMAVTSSPVSTLHPARRGTRPITAEDLWTLPRLGAPQAFPNGQALVVPITRWNLEKNES